MLPRRCLAPLVLASLLISPPALTGQDRPYTEGPVWVLTMIRTTTGLGDDYLRSLANTYKRVNDEAKKQGLLVSYRIISTNTTGPDDWDILIMEEYKNWAAFDGIRDKFDPIQKKVVGDESANRQLMTKRLDVRRILGSKFGQELILK